MIIAGIDQSYSGTAICIFDTKDGKLLKCMVLKSLRKYDIMRKKTKDDKIIPFEQRIIFLSKEIIDILKENDVQDISIEGLSLMSKSASSLVLAGLFYNLLIEFYKNFMNVKITPPKTLKAFALHGNAQKVDMFNSIQDHDREMLIRTGYKKTTGLYDLSDAYFLGKLLISRPIKIEEREF